MYVSYVPYKKRTHTFKQRSTDRDTEGEGGEEREREGGMDGGRETERARDRQSERRQRNREEQPPSGSKSLDGARAAKGYAIYMIFFNEYLILQSL